MHGERERAEDFTPGGPRAGGSDEYAPLSILHQLYEAVVAGFVDPATSRRR